MRKTQTSSERQKEIFQYIKAFLLEKGYPPSVREIGKAVGLKSSSTVHGYLSRLEESGMIKRDPTKPRAIDILDEKPWGKSVAVPFIGTLTADTPVFAQQNIQDIFSFPQELIGTADKTFMLRVSGENMPHAGIFAGDYIMVQQQDTACDGELVVVFADKEEGATIKRLYHEKDGIRLQSEDAVGESLYKKDVSILGKVIGVYHPL